MTASCDHSACRPGDRLRYAWQFYREVGGYSGSAATLADAAQPQPTLTIPLTAKVGVLHILLLVTDNGEPPLTRYGRVVVDVRPMP